MRQKVVAGNWKMNSSQEFVADLLADLTKGVKNIKSKVIVCPPFPYLAQAETLTKASNVLVGAQDLNINSSGAFTGEVSADMIKDFGCKYVIVGHSERRELYNESNDVVAAKVKTALDNELTPILCVGELLSDREANKTEQVIKEQLNAVINKVGIDVFENIIIAYEPVWAIGTGKTATPEQAQDVHKFIRNLVGDKNKNIAEKIQILYGGSVNAENAKSLFSCADIDGGLIGGASLTADDFLGICSKAG